MRGFLRRFDQPNPVLHLEQSHILTVKDSAEMYFHFTDADPTAAGDGDSPVVQGIAHIRYSFVGPGRAGVKL